MNSLMLILGAAAYPEPGTSTNPIVIFLNKVLEWLFDVTEMVGLPSYALALLIFTIIIKVLLYPLAVKQMRSTRDMQKLQPKVKALQEKYKNNPQKLQEAQMKLYRDMNINPMAGCLPLLVQLPIIWFLFSSIRNFIPANPDYYTFFWVSDLSNPDTTIFLPLLVAASTFIQQFISITNRQDPTQKSMLIIMPIMIGFFCRSFPAAVALYWIFYGLLSGIQQFIINAKGKREDAKQAAIEAEQERILAEERAAAKAAKAQNKKPANNHKQQKSVKAESNEEVVDFSDEAIEALENQIAELDKKWAPPGSDIAVQLADLEDALRKAQEAKAAAERHALEEAEAAVENMSDK